MATNEQHASSWQDTLILWIAVAILVASIVGYYYFTQFSDLVRVLGMLAGAAIAVLVAVQSEFGRAGWSYVQGSRTELRRVVWPSRKETVQTTAMVIIVVLLLAIFIWALDVLLGWGVQLLTGRA